MVKSYLCIESQSAFDAAGTAQFLALARDLKSQGNTVEIWLTQNGVIPARVGTKDDGLAEVLKAGIAIWADDFSLRERAVPPASLKRGIRPAAIATVVERMAAGWNVIWH